MSHVSLNFEDAENGEIAFQACYTEGEDPYSNAHKMAGQVIKWLEQEAKTKREAKCETANTGVISTPGSSRIFHS